MNPTANPSTTRRSSSGIPVLFAAFVAHALLLLTMLRMRLKTPFAASYGDHSSDWRIPKPG